MHNKADRLIYNMYNGRPGGLSCPATCLSQSVLVKGRNQYFGGIHFIEIGVWGIVLEMLPTVHLPPITV